MPVSQFTIYSSSDASGPGPIQGVVGDMLRVLNACLVNGYPGKAAAGWTKPLADSANAGCYQNGTGSSQLNLHIDDTAAQYAYATGWETISAVGGVGTGTGQFPTPAQHGTTGRVNWIKSTTASAVPRTWIIAADAHTCYMWTDIGSNGVYAHYAFGDVFSLKPTTDTYRCMIYGSSIGTTMLTAPTGMCDCLTSSQAATYWGVANPNFIMHYMARTWGGGGSSIQIGRGGDLQVSIQFNATYPYAAYQFGNQPYGPDNTVYMSPLRVFEYPSGQYRGRFRGLYMPAHYYTQFSDGQTFSGAGDYAGKTFQVVHRGGNLGVWLVETSNTVETN